MMALDSCLAGLMILTAQPVDAAERPPVDGGPCDYQSTAGIALIQEWAAVSPEENNCAQAVRLVFDFVPDDPDASRHYPTRTVDVPDTSRTLMVGGGKNPPLQWVVDQGLTPGSIHRCERRDITAGTCTPVNFRFLEIDYTSYVTDCFERR